MKNVDVQRLRQKESNNNDFVVSLLGYEKPAKNERHTIASKQDTERLDRIPISGISEEYYRDSQEVQDGQVYEPGWIALSKKTHKRHWVCEYAQHQDWAPRKQHAIGF